MTDHFSIEELTASDLAIRKRIDNTPDEETKANLNMLADGLERVRTILGSPMTITSGYRSQKLNSVIGGARSSQHTLGLAADFKVPNMAPKDVCQAIIDHEELVRFDQLICEGTWVHISFSDNPRGDVLTAHFGGVGTSYTKGV